MLVDLGIYGCTNGMYKLVELRISWGCEEFLGFPWISQKTCSQIPKQYWTIAPCEKKCVRVNSGHENECNF